MTFDDLTDGLGWLDSHIDYESTAFARRALPTLERIRGLCDLLGDPQHAYPTVHITGTNGKGSTAAMVTALLAAQGLVVGTYTSPNLTRVNERLARNGEPIDDASFLEILESLSRLEPMLDDRPTRFELLTAGALAWFADEAVDAAVIEVGLGGQWDSTNVVDGDVSVITNISYDHTEVLGPTLEDIARDKAGIFKSGSRVAIGEVDPVLVAILSDAARQAGATEVWRRDQEFACTANRTAVGGRLIDVRTPGAHYGELLVPLFGAHQGDNASVALAVAELFFGRPLADEVAAQALAGVRVPGRLEVIGRRPLVLVDGAHNAAGMTALGRSLTEEFAVTGHLGAVVGMLSGRDPAAMLEPLRRAGVEWVVVCAPDSPRALPVTVVAEAATALGFDVTVCTPPAEAVRVAVNRAGEDDGVVVCGSLYVVADARRVLVADGV
jgi:dihydrofolate synthase / folylpolyglutamate synthase